MSLVGRLVENPVKVAVGVLLLVMFGVLALLRMPMQLTPEVQTPTITIETRWPGASPVEVEREIVQEQEEQLKGIEGLDKVSSECQDSSGKVTLEFVVGTNMSAALLKVNSRLQQVREYPEEADEPVITTANSSDRPIGWFILRPRVPDEADIGAFSEEAPGQARGPRTPPCARTTAGCACDASKRPSPRTRTSPPCAPPRSTSRPTAASRRTSSRRASSACPAWPTRTCSAAARTSCR